MSYTIEMIAEQIGATRIGNTSAVVNWLLTDSRLLSFPEETLFFSLETKQEDGTGHIPDLYARGVRNFVVNVKNTRVNGSAPMEYSDYPDCNFLLVSNSLKALQKLSEQHRSRFHIPVIGITGCSGKTIVKEWLYQLLSPDRIIVRSPHSYTSQIGVPVSVWQMNEQTQLAIIEAGISEAGEMRALQNIIKPTIGVLTSISSSRKEKFLSVQERCTEELSLLKDCDVIIYNGDNEMMSSYAGKSLLSAREIAWSRVDKDKPLYISSVKKETAHTVISYQYLGMSNTFSIPFIDDISIENALNSLAVCLYLMLSPETITERMATLEPISMRLEVKEGINNSILIDDSYDLDFSSLEVGLDFLYRHAKDKGMKQTLIVSDVLDTGQSSSVLYKKIAKIVHEYGVSKIIGVGYEISLSAARFEMEKYFFPDTESLLKSDVLKNTTEEVVLIKGARSFGFERITDQLEYKIHDTTLDVNLSALVNNLNYFRSKLEPTTKTVCMVKALSYGSGSVEIAEAFQKQNVDYFGVAVVDEGLDLRNGGITTPIIVMNPEPAAFKTMFKYRLEPEIYNFYILEAFIREAERNGILYFPVHIKIDTGMHRLGFGPAEIPSLIKRLKEQNTVIPRSIFSHLSGSGGEEFDYFTREQITLFDRVSTEFQAAFSHRILKHISNSAGVERFLGEAQFDMIRLGIGLYGVNPKDNSIINNVSTLHSTILQIRNVPPGDTVGYSRLGKITTDSKIAVLRIGYADGLNRHLGNRNFYCLVNGQKAYYVGSICMDLCMVDVTDIDCKEGDRVVLFGEGLPVTFMADQLETISHEVLTGVSARVKRVYFYD